MWAQYMEHGLEYVMFYVQKHIAPVAICSNPIRALPVPEIEALSLTKLHTSGGRRNM